MGVGCEKVGSLNPAPTITPGIQQESTRPESVDDTSITDLNSGITLKAEGLASTSTVQFQWEVRENIAEDAEGYRIVQSKDPNPEWPSTYWHERGPAHRELTKAGWPSGTQHFRICVVKNKTCTIYSNDVIVEVK